jgi:glycosyltransferase involved in cell wall biosynthesis
MKVLWLGNYPFIKEAKKETGTWYISMGKALVEAGKVELYNITYGDVKTITTQNYNNISQWIIPFEDSKKYQLPSKKIIDFISQKEKEIKPELIHIWGTEHNWSLMHAKKYFKAPVIVEIQGLLHIYAKVFYGGLTLKEIIACTGLKEILVPSRSLFFRKYDFTKRAERELHTIRNIDNISVTTGWVKAHIKVQNNICNIFTSGILLREEFYKASAWKYTCTRNPIIFTSCSGSNTYKGLHVLIRAFAILKRYYPEAELRIASNIFSNRIKWLKDGYISWLLKEIKKLDIDKSIIWLEPLHADSLIEELQKASVAVVPSYVETYCLALAEAMIIGTPTVVSYAAAMPELAKHEETTMFFPIGDHVACASEIIKLLKDENLSKHISRNSIQLVKQRNDPRKVINNQVELYKHIIEGSRQTMCH